MSGRTFNKFNIASYKQNDPRIKITMTLSEANQMNQQTVKYKVYNGPKNELHSNKGDIEIKKRRILEEG